MKSHIAESERLYLQPLTIAQHLNPYHALNSDVRISRWSNRPPTKDLSDAEALMRTRLPSAEKPFLENYAIMLKHEEKEKKKDGEGEKGREEMIGVIGIPRLSHDGAAAEVGYAILPAFWGMGYASETLVLFGRYYFSSERIFQKETLVAETEPENAASERVLIKAGFKRGEFVRGAFEVVDFVTGERSMRDATEWSFTRSQLEDP